MNSKRIMISGISSGCGKTTVTAALLKGFKNRGLNIQSFKCGPDYIDPQIHRFITGAPTVNLDPFMSGEHNIREIFQIYARYQDICVIEGAMGYYDGMGNGSVSSAYHIASLTDTPVILAVNPKGCGLTAAAVIKGVIKFKEPSHIIGVILSNIKESMYFYYKKILEDNGIHVFGYLPHMEQAHFKSRYLGLYLADEIEELSQKIEILGEAAEQNIDVERILQAAQKRWELQAVKPVKRQHPVCIGIAYDEAFSFYYHHNLNLLESMGAKIVRFSPIHDERLPNEIDGVILGGGYPELYLKELSGNRSFLQSFRQASAGGLPIIAECGGFVYLNHTAQYKDGGQYPLAGLLPGKVYMTQKLQRFGYSTITAKQNNLLLERGEQLRGHEFHYSDSTDCGNDCIIEKSRKRSEDGVFTTDNLFAGYPHIDFYSNRRAAVRFLKKCSAYQKKRMGLTDK